jgi:tetratricopeptide (TPR) repeat protein
MASARKSKARVDVRAPRNPVSVPWWPYALAAFGALFAAFQAYSPTLRAPFLFDDAYLPFTAAGATDSLWAWLQGVRPALMASYWFNYRVSGQDTFSYHVINVLFHVINSGLVFLIARKLLGLAGEIRRVDLLAAFAAGVFLLHPVQTESVAYVASRSETQSTLFYYAAFVVFLYHKEAAVSWRSAAAIFALFGLAVATKEHTVTLPVLLLLTDYFWNPGFSLSGMRRNWRVYVPVVLGGVALGGYVASRAVAGSQSAGFGLSSVSPLQYLLTQFGVFFHYVRLFVVPVNLNADYDHPFAKSLLDNGAWFWLPLLMACVFAAWLMRRRYPLAAYGFFAILLLLAPTSSILPIQDPIAERRMYLPMIGYLLVLLEAVRRLRLPQMQLAGAMAALLIAAGAGAYVRNQVWSGVIPLWEDTVRKNPHKRRPGFQLAFAYYEANRCADAVREYGRVATLEPPDYELLVDWALAYDCMQGPDQALEKLEQAAKQRPGAHVFAMIGMMHAKRSRWEEALTALDTADRYDGGYAMTHVYRGNIFLRTGRAAEALPEFEKALALEPGNQAARSGIVAARQAALRAR